MPEIVDGLETAGEAVRDTFTGPVYSGLQTAGHGIKHAGSVVYDKALLPAGTFIAETAVVGAGAVASGATTAAYAVGCALTTAGLAIAAVFASPFVIAAAAVAAVAFIAFLGFKLFGKKTEKAPDEIAAIQPKPAMSNATTAPRREPAVAV